MNRSDIIDRMSELYPKLLQKEIDAVVKLLFSTIADNIVMHNRIEVRGFGAFSLKERGAGLIRNPREGISLKSEGRYVVYFRAGKELKERVNSAMK